MVDKLLNIFLGSVRVIDYKIIYEYKVYIKLYIDDYFVFDKSYVSEMVKFIFNKYKNIDTNEIVIEVIEFKCNIEKEGKMYDSYIKLIADMHELCVSVSYNDCYILYGNKHEKFMSFINIVNMIHMIINTYSMYYIGLLDLTKFSYKFNDSINHIENVDKVYVLNKILKLFRYAQVYMIYETRILEDEAWIYIPTNREFAEDIKILVKCIGFKKVNIITDSDLVRVVKFKKFCKTTINAKYLRFGNIHYDDLNYFLVIVVKQEDYNFVKKMSDEFMVKDSVKIYKLGEIPIENINYIKKPLKIIKIRKCCMF